MAQGDGGGGTPKDWYTSYQREMMRNIENLQQQAITNNSIDRGQQAGQQAQQAFLAGLGQPTAYNASTGAGTSTRLAEVTNSYNDAIQNLGRYKGGMAAIQAAPGAADQLANAWGIETDAEKRQAGYETAQNQYNRALNLLQMVQQAEAQKPISQSLAQGWGQTKDAATQAIQNIANQYMNKANAAEGARQAIAAQNPLIAGTAK